MLENEECPLGKGTPIVGCSQSKCQYHVEGNCEFLACQSIIGEERRDKRLQMTTDLYKITAPELQSRAHDVMIAILLNGFFEHVFNKSILDCTASDLKTLRESEEQFYSWRNKERPKFAECIRVLALIETNL